MTKLDPSLETNQRKMKVLLTELTTGEGLRPTIVDGVKLARADGGFPRRPVLYEPSICDRQRPQEGLYRRSTRRL